MKLIRETLQEKIQYYFTEKKIAESENLSPHLNLRQAQ